MKIATYNVNGINGRLAVLLRWLELAEPDIVCLQELKAPQERFPEIAIRDAGYRAIWHGQSRWNGVALLSRIGEIHETWRGLPGDPEDIQSRYVEAAVNGVLIAGLYLPNGNPRPGPKYDFKLRWFDRLHAHLATLIDLDVPVIIAGDYNVMPTDQDVYAPERWRDDALFAPEVRAAWQRFLDQGWVDALRHLHPRDTICTFWKYWRGAIERNAGRAACRGQGRYARAGLGEDQRSRAGLDRTGGRWQAQSQARNQSGKEGVSMARSIAGWKLEPEDRAVLLARFPARYSHTVADHVTLRFGTDGDTPLPTADRGEVIGEADDGAGVQALVVRISGTTERGDGSHFHITWSLADGRQARQSNDVIRDHGWRAIDPPLAIRLEPMRWSP